ncbi:MAG: hypothetical protein WCJ57_04495 [Candidatus Falkowbacteria bacterium]
MKRSLFFLLFAITFSACTSNQETKQKVDEYPITYVAVTPAGWTEEIIYICGEVRYLPNGHVRCRVKYVDGQVSKDSIDFGSGTRIVPADIWFVK